MEADECEKLAKASANVLRHYNTPALAAKTKDWVSFAIVVGELYGTRIMAASVRRAGERANRPTNVVPMARGATVHSPMGPAPNTTMNGQPQAEPAAAKFETVITEQGPATVRIN